MYAYFNTKDTRPKYPCSYVYLSIYVHDIQAFNFYDLFCRMCHWCMYDTHLQRYGD